METKKEDNSLDQWRREVLGADYEEELGDLSEKRNLFEVESIIKHAEKTRKLHLPTLGSYILIKPLRVIDEEIIQSIEHPNPQVQRNLRNRMKVWKLVERTGETDLTKEVIDNLPANVVDTILAEYNIQEEERFLLPILERRRSGLRVISEPNNI